MAINKDLTIRKIEKEFEKLSNLVLEQLNLLDELIITPSEGVRKDLCLKLENNEKKIDSFEVQLDDSIIKAVVLYQPVATDLRRLFAIYHMTINLERVGDLVQKIMIIYRELRESELLGQSENELRNMLKITSGMVTGALLSFINNDQEIATRTIRSDSTLDEMNRKLLKRVIKVTGLPKESQSILNNLVDMRAIFSSLERIGDHATNIAEASIYAISGSNIRHRG